MALGAVDQRLIEQLEDVDLDVMETESRDMARQPHDEIPAGWIVQDPIEEIAFDGADDAHGREPAAAQKIAGVVDLETQNAGGNRLGYHNKVGVLQPKGLVLDVPAIDQAQELLPEASLQRNRRL